MTNKELGRKGLGYYKLKGKPLNVYSHSKFIANKELTEPYIKNESSLRLLSLLMQI